jgi:hypothetical protein
MRLSTKLVAGVGIIALAGACVRGDPVSPAGNEEGNAWLFTGSATNPSPVLPNGTANVLTNIAVSSVLRDAFGRQFPGDVGRRSHYFHTGLVHWFWPFDAARGSLGASPVDSARWDPRYPFLTSDSTTMGRGMHLIIPSSGFAGADFYELWIEGDVRRLKPSTQYQVVFVNYQLKQVGALDQEERVLSGTISEPDSLLLPAGSAPGSITSDWTGAAPAGCDPYPAAVPNPFIVATATSDGGGFLSVDKCWTPNGVLATLANGVGASAQPKFMVGRNDDQAYDLPNYNYIEVWEGTYGSAAGPAYRVQIAQDLDLTGAPIANAFAPFPAPNTVLVNSAASPNLSSTGQTTPPAVDRAAAYPLTLAEQVALPGTEGEPDSVIVTLNNVEPLAGGAVYMVWYANPTSNAAQPATGHWVRVVGTDTVASASGTSTFDGGPGQITFTTDPYGDIGQPDVSDSLSTLIVSIETNAGATSPSSTQPFWATVLKTVGGSVGGALRFGEFTFGDDTRDPEVFTTQGSMAGGVIGDTVVIFVDTTINGEVTKIRAAQFVGSHVEVKFTGLMRPPLGYRYAAYLCGSDDGTCSPTDPSTQFYDLGGLTSPTGVSLDNADVAPVDGNLSPTRIVSAFASGTVTGGQTLCDFDRFRLVLEPIAGGGPPLAHIFDAALPPQLTEARSCR